MSNTTDEFLRESHRIDQLIWDAMSLMRGERVLFLGYGNDVAWVRRAAAVGVDVTVIESNEAHIVALAAGGIRVIRGSATMIPARDESYDAVVAFHYLHEIDPTFHAQVVSELARVGRRVVVVEPGPPPDPLGRRIAELYSRAKYEAGAFEEYQSIDYWRKLLAMVKADVLMQQFTFTRLAPRFAVDETVDLILEAMAIEQMPQEYLDELRALADRPDAQLSPLSRYVLVALAAGEPVRASAGTLFRDEPAPAVAPNAAIEVAAAAAATASAAAGLTPAADAHFAGAEFPPVLPPAGAPATPEATTSFGAAAGASPGTPPVGAPPASPPSATNPATPPPPFVPPPAFGAPAAATPGAAPAAPPATMTPFGMPAAEPDAPFGASSARPEPAFGLPDPAPFGKPPASNPNAAPFGTPFALPDDPDPFGLNPDPAQRPGADWSWEPPDGQSEIDEPFGL